MTNFALKPWNPTTNVRDLKVLGKLGEECGELSSCISRCIIQGFYESEPVTNKENREWLEDEIADVLANIELAIEYFQLDKERIKRRSIDKKKHLLEWQEMP